MAIMCYIRVDEGPQSMKKNNYLYRIHLLGIIHSTGHGASRDT